MLICYRFAGENSLTIGIALYQWLIKGDPRIYVLLPEDDKKYCEVEVLFPPEYEWCLLDSKSEKIFFDSREVKKEEALILEDEIEEDLYFVWDDGASRHTERAAKLYDYFKPMIEEHRETALNIKNTYFDEEYQKQLAEAKNKGWDTDLITRKQPMQTYGSN